MSTSEARSRLAAAQEELVASLTKSGAPPGFDPSRLHAAAIALASKRRRAVAGAWPALTQSLGERFAELFADYAASAPLPTRGGALADGFAFARRLAAAGVLPDAGRLELLAVSLRYVARPDGIGFRRGPSLVASFPGKPRRLIVGLRLPYLGEHWFSLAL